MATLPFVSFLIDMRLLSSKKQVVLQKLFSTMEQCLLVNIWSKIPKLGDQIDMIVRESQCRYFIQIFTMKYGYGIMVV
jgi:ABC-type uncharacterized transport system permease subunit